MLGELESDDQIVIGDLEAGVGTVLRLQDGQADVVVVVAQPTAKSIEVARRAIQVATRRDHRVVVVANRVRDDADLDEIRAVVGDEQELIVVPDDPAIAEADRDGRAPIDVDSTAPGVRAIVALADRLAGIGAAA